MAPRLTSHTSDEQSTSNRPNSAEIETMGQRRVSMKDSVYPISHQQQIP